LARGSQTMTERDRLLDEIGGLEVRLLAGMLPVQTVSLLDYDLTLQQLRAFALVFARGETPINKLADSLGIKPNVATGIIQRLVERGIVERYEDPADRRVRLVRVTGKGSALVDEMGKIVFAKGRELLEKLTDEELRQLADVLAAMER
jgi:DNA-binding MarR family transcriptional regulator